MGDPKFEDESPIAVPGSAERLEFKCIEKLKQLEDGSPNVVFIFDFKTNTDFMLLKFDKMKERVKEKTPKGSREYDRIKGSLNREDNLISGVLYTRFPPFIEEFDKETRIHLKINPNAKNPLDKEFYKNWKLDKEREIGIVICPEPPKLYN